MELRQSNQVRLLWTTVWSIAVPFALYACVVLAELQFHLKDDSFANAKVVYAGLLLICELVGFVPLAVRLGAPAFAAAVLYFPVMSWLLLQFALRLAGGI
jgi:hypothetical protein